MHTHLESHILHHMVLPVQDYHPNNVLFLRNTPITLHSIRMDLIPTCFAIGEKDALKGHANYHCWNKALTQAMADAGVIGHICSEHAPSVARMEPVYHPELSDPPAPAELEARRIWDRNNALAAFTMMSKDYWVW
ncbi:hypothetical protein BT96DRAFT_1001328 [Gymnopus androsaceus JB14]|uniref:Uncharacterized protein n=1 Tax=Gymnopus androsaceus JB14 TaxID=1447944 RepID=A0A6A4H168_9AGAR|nr:hypothetical protein BT96DRAFT_1001328 [Gymnopus androsaceus JB14]